MTIGAEVSISEREMKSEALNHKAKAKEDVQKLFLAELAKNYEYIEERDFAGRTFFRMEMICINRDGWKDLLQDFDEIVNKYPESEPIVANIKRKIFYR